MKQLHLTLSPDFFDQCPEYFYYNDFSLKEDNLVEFFNRIEAICFNDYCKFYYSPLQSQKLLEYFEIMEESLGFESRFLKFLDSENIDEANAKNEGGRLFKYLGYGHFPEIQGSEVTKAIYEMENVALIDFSEKNTETGSIQVILDLENRLKTPKDWVILRTYAAFLNWSLELNPRTFDETMNAKHPVDGRRGFGSSLLCSIDEVKKILQVAYYKSAHHENHLFYYHFPKRDRPILWLKATSSFHFHGFHITEQEAIQKKLDIDALKNYSGYLSLQNIL